MPLYARYWILGVNKREMVTSLTDFIIQGRKMDQKKIQTKIRRINQKLSKRIPHVKNW